jgi:hypothetical protein
VAPLSNVPTSTSSGMSGSTHVVRRCLVPEASLCECPVLALRPWEGGEKQRFDHKCDLILLLRENTYIHTIPFQKSCDELSNAQYTSIISLGIVFRSVRFTFTNIIYLPHIYIIISCVRLTRCGQLLWSTSLRGLCAAPRGNARHPRRRFPCVGTRGTSGQDRAGTTELSCMAPLKA